MNRSLSSLAIAVFFCATPAFAQTFVFDMRGSQEVPPVSTAATGGCMAQLDQPNAKLSITCVHDVVNATIMHIHHGAAGATGPVAFDLGSPASPVVATWTGMTASDISDLLAGNLYVNIHTAGRPNGEIRGQILPRTVDTVSFSANGGQVVPPNSSSATASCSADLSNDATQLAIQCTHNLASPQSAHVSEAPAGQNGPIVYTLPSATSPISASMLMTPRLVADFAATFLYLEIAGPEGAEDVGTPTIRGQIGTPPAAPTTGTIKIVKKTSPAGGTGFSFTDNVPGSGSFTLDDGATHTMSNVTPGVYSITENNPSGSTLSNITCGDDDGSVDVNGRTANVHLQAGETVTCTFTNLMTQGPASTLFVFHLSGDQEVPPVTTNQRGGCFAQFNAGTSTLSLLCVHDVNDATVMHIHHGAPGAAGAVAFDLGSPQSPVVATWTGMTPADVADLLAGNLYINIHTDGRPSGAIRGQILPRTVDTVSFTADGAHVVPPSATTATGSCSADLSNDATQLAVQCTHNEPAPDSAHINEAPEGQNGPIVYTFPSAASPLSANVPMTPRLVADFAAAFLYLEIDGQINDETANAPAIRGQIGAPFVTPTTGTIIITKKTTPAGGAGFGFTDNVPGSTGSFTLNDGASKTFLNVPAGTYTIAENDPAASGYSLTSVVCGDADSDGNPFNRTATVRLQGGESVHCTFANLQSVTPTSLFVFRLTPDQEVPPVSSSERGGCFAQFNSASKTLSLVCTHDIPDPTIMHIHRGASGVAGPVAFDLGNPQSPVQATWANMTGQDVADLLAGNLYVNIHTSGRPSGALRGQIVPRGVDSFTFPMTAAQEVPPTDSPAKGVCFADLSDNATSLAVQCTHNVPSAIAAHLHDAPPGVDGPVVFDYPVGSTFSGTTPLTPRLVADFAAGFLYVNVHSVNYDTGEIRGQVAEAPVEPAPALGEWVLIALAMTVAAVGLARMR